LADDMGYADPSCFGGKAVSTPNLDRLAAQGMKFTQFYSASAVCTPTRTSVLTGRYPLRFDIRRHFPGTNDSHLPTGAVTLPELLRAAGYATSTPIIAITTSNSTSVNGRRRDDEELGMYCTPRFALYNRDSLTTGLFTTAQCRGGARAIAQRWPGSSACQDPKERFDMSSNASGGEGLAAPYFRRRHISASVNPSSNTAVDGSGTVVAPFASLLG